MLFCGINPGAYAAKHGHHFLGHGNRFWRVLYLAGFTPELIHATHDRTLIAHGCGITSAVGRPTARAADLAKLEYLQAKQALVTKVLEYRPARLAFLGKAAFEAMFEVRHPAWGLQAQTIAETAIWLLPNPSGLNRGFSLEDLVEAYRALRAGCDSRGQAADPVHSRQQLAGHG